MLCLFEVQLFQEESQFQNVLSQKVPNSILRYFSNLLHFAFTFADRRNSKLFICDVITSKELRIRADSSIQMQFDVQIFERTALFSDKLILGIAKLYAQKLRQTNKNNRFSTFFSFY